MADSLFLHSQALTDPNRSFAALLMELFRIYAADDTEKANVQAVNEIKRSFAADEAALFYINGQNEHHMCLADLEFPIKLSDTLWRVGVEAHSAEDEVTRFGPWSIPGMGKRLGFWLSTRLYHLDAQGGYIFLGKDDGPWLESQLASLAMLKQSIAPIFKVRHEREIAEYRRSESEKRLAVSEARLRSLFDNLRDMVYTVDANDVITEVSHSACSMLGYGSRNDIIGKPFGSLLAMPQSRLLFLDKIHQEGIIDDYEIVLRKQDDSRIFCLETAHVHRDKSGGIVEIQGIVKDISDRIRNERELWKRNLELADANQKLQKTQQLMVQHEKMASIGQLAAGVAHEINNPLGFLTSNQTMLEKYARKISEAWRQAKASDPSLFEELEQRVHIGRLFEESLEIFAESNDGFERIKRIVSNLKSFSRIDRSNDYEDFDVNAGLESTLVVAWNEIKYVADVQKDLGTLPTVRCKGSEVNQVFLNILVNAAQALGEFKHVEKGIISVRTSQQGSNAVISIGDDGPGIPEAIQNKIFDPFFTTKAPGKGTGLGLSISYDIIVNKHGGALWVEASPGAGTTFFISLPISGPASQSE